MHALLLVTREAMAMCAPAGKTIFYLNALRFARIFAVDGLRLHKASRNGPVVMTQQRRPG
jgi:hypothetical protein